LHVDYRSDGTILLLAEAAISAEIAGLEAACLEARMLAAEELAVLEPGLKCGSRAIWLPEAAIDPRQLITAALRLPSTLASIWLVGAESPNSSLLVDVFPESARNKRNFWRRLW
jgi:hypothetical protein